MARESRARLNGPDQNFRYALLRPIPICWGGFSRLLTRTLARQATWVAFGSLALSQLILAPVFVAHRNTPLPSPWNKPIAYPAVSALLFTAFSFLGFVIAQARTRIEQASPTNRISAEILAAVNKYAPSRKSPKECRLDVALNDSGPISIISATARDLLQVNTNSNQDVFQAAWESDPTKRFRLLLANPCSKCLLARDRRLNGRICEFYINPYIRMLAVLEKHTKSHPGQIEIRYYDSEPEYRMLLSAERLVLQRYGRFSHGWQDPPIVLHSVLFATAVKSALRSASPDPMEQCEHIEKCAFSSFKSALATELDNDPSKSQYGFDGDRQSIFDYYRTLFERNWQSAADRVECCFIDWPTERLQVLAKHCHVDKKTVRNSHWKSDSLRDAILHRLGLFEEFENQLKGSEANS